MILNKPLVRLTTAHYQSAVSMISFAQVLTVQWSDTIPCQNVQFQVRITSHNIPFQQASCLPEIVCRTWVETGVEGAWEETVVKDAWEESRVSTSIGLGTVVAVLKTLCGIHRNVFQPRIVWKNLTYLWNLTMITILDPFFIYIQLCLVLSPCYGFSPFVIVAEDFSHDGRNLRHTIVIFSQVLIYSIL